MQIQYQNYMKVGDLLLVTGTAFFEKTKIVDRNKGIYTLENGIKTDRNSSSTEFNI